MLQPVSVFAHRIQLSAPETKRAGKFSVSRLRKRVTENKGRSAAKNDRTGFTHVTHTSMASRTVPWTGNVPQDPSPGEWLLCRYTSSASPVVIAPLQQSRAVAAVAEAHLAAV